MQRLYSITPTNLARVANRFTRPVPFLYLQGWRVFLCLFLKSDV
jgi:hypothetical protein